MESIWSKTTALPERDPLPGNITADAAVIGGGMAGILTAYQLRRRGIDAVVLEAERVGSGQTKNTTAKVTSQHGPVYHKLCRQVGEGKAGEYLRRNQQAIDEYERIVREFHIDCGFQRLPACLYTETQGELLARECAAARRLGLDARIAPTPELPFPSAKGLWFPNQAQFHPLAFLSAVSQKVPVFEHTRVVSAGPHAAMTDRGVVSAKYVVFATHYPFVNFPGFYFARMHQERSYVLALEGAFRPSAMYYGMDPGGLSLRGYGDTLLLGGAGHRTGEQGKADPFGELRSRARELWPGCRELAAFAAQDCMTLDGVPYIGRFSPTRPSWYVATGFGKWGMTSSMVSAQLLAEEVAGEVKKEKSLFSPRRAFSLPAWKSFLKDGGKSAKGLLKEVLYFPGKEFDSLAPGQGAVIRWCGKKRGAYKDQSGKVYLVSTRCPHLGCQLEWNAAEKTWDCPCHGSRFDCRGNLIDNPAQCGLKNTKGL